MRGSCKHCLLALVLGFLWASLLLPCAATEGEDVLEGDVSAHDPHIAKEGSTYYLVGSMVGSKPNGFIPILCSTNLKRWAMCSDVFDSAPAWIDKEMPGARGAWAPDFGYFGGRWHIYYASSMFGKNTSVIGVASNKTLDYTSKDYKWVDDGMVIKSLPRDDWNAIDPNIVIDDKGQVWMDFGSFWSGIKMVRIDPLTGKRSAEDMTVYSLASRPPAPPTFGSIEGPYIFHHGEFYYLFVSFDFCCKGAASNYNIRVGRALQPIGPYLDKDGIPMLKGGGTLLQKGNEEWRGPGHNSVLHDVSGDYIFFHAYQGKTGRPFLQIGRMEWKDGWPEIVSVWRPSKEAQNRPMQLPQ